MTPAEQIRAAEAFAKAKIRHPDDQQRFVERVRQGLDRATSQSREEQSRPDADRKEQRDRASRAKKIERIRE